MCGKNKSLTPDGHSVLLLRKVTSSLDADSTNYFHFPFGISSSEDGRIFVSALLDHKVYVLDTSLAVIQTLGSIGQGPGELFSPAFVTIHNGYLYVVEWGNNRISIFTVDGRFDRTLKIPLNFRGVNVAIDSKGRIYVANPASDHLITVLDQEGNIAFSFGDMIDRPGVSLRRLNIALLCIDQLDNVYVVFITHHTVRKYDSSFQLKWEKDYSKFPPMAWYLEFFASEKKQFSLQTLKKTEEKVVATEPYRYFALDCQFYDGKLCVEYAGIPPHGNGIYEIDASNGEITRVLLFSHLDRSSVRYDITNFCFPAGGRVLGCDREAGQVLLFDAK